MILRSTILLLMVASICQCHNETMIKQYLDQQFKCSNGAEASTRILVLTPGDKNLPLQWFEKLPLVPQDKSHNYPLTYSALISNQPDTCYSFIELPRMFNDEDILSNMKWLLKRCFNKIIIHLPKSLDWQDPELAMFTSFMRMFLSSYSRQSSSRMGILVVENEAGNSQNNFEAGLNQWKSMLGLSRNPPKAFIAPSKTANSRFSKFINAIGSEDRCKAEECLNTNSGFFMKNSDKSGKGLPWLGHPSIVEFNEKQPAKISCYSNDLKKDLELLDATNDGFGFDTNQVQYSGKTSTVINKVRKTTFTINYRADRVGTFKCKNANGESQYPIQLKKAKETWAEWSQWSKCDDELQVGKAKVNRTRRLFPGNKVQSQERYCQCSDLKELPRPRIVLLGKTGVGKSSVGSQLFGDRNSFVVGHSIQSETLNINVKADHYLGYGKCITIIDTPGVKDTEGRDYEHTLNMKLALQKEIKSVDIFLLLLHGKDHRFDQGTEELLLWYQAIFGVDMWKHLIVETTFWRHSQKEAEFRKRENGGLTEVKRSKEWEPKFHRHPYNVDQSIKIPFVYIDPVAHVYADHCSKSKNVPDEREWREFFKWTSYLINSYDEKQPPFDCASLCQAPPTVFSGIPVLVNPKGGQVTFHTDANTDQYIEWQYLQSLGSEDAFANSRVMLNNTPLDTSRIDTIIDLPEEGLQYKIEKNDAIQKVVIVKLYLWATGSLQNIDTTASLSNSKGMSDVAHISWSRQPVMSMWTEWSECSIQCIGSDGKMGERTRQRHCTEGINSQLTCQAIGGQELKPDLTEIGRETCPKETGGKSVWCPQDPYWTEWAEWSDCNPNCGEGQQTRRRFCIDGKFGGAQCQSNSEVDTRTCVNQNECPQNCKFGSWGEWSQCGQTCFEGMLPPMQVRNREIIQESVGTGLSCDALISQESRYCMGIRQCPVDGSWNPFGPWSSCSNECKGKQWRHRTCNAPQNGGKPCSGVSLEEKTCNEVCPCTFTEWSPWGSCSKWCGTGQQERSRTRSGDCLDSDGGIRETQACNQGTCPPEPQQESGWVKAAPAIAAAVPGIITGIAALFG